MKKIIHTVFISLLKTVDLTQSRALNVYKLPGLFLTLLAFVSIQTLYAQSGGWDGKNEWVAGQGYQDFGNGVIQLLNDANNGCEATAVYETSSKYNFCSGNFNKCYKILFGCNDSGADGLAFTFAGGFCTNISDYKVWGCGGGLGYVDACANNKGITIEFDTFNNGGVDDFDTGYEGTGTQDQVAIHKNMQAKTASGKVTGVAVPNLEDGQVHTVCISYDNTSHVLSASIDGSTVISYDLDLAGLDFETYFGSCIGLDQFWSAGTNGGTNVEVVSNGADIYSNAGALCPGMLPVQFQRIAAKATSSSVMVTWSTATEASNKKFIVERSDNLLDWEVIGEVSGMGNSASVVEYSFADQEPLSGTSYYRVKQVDFDGAFSYSGVASVEQSSDYFIDVAPNPFDNVLSIKTNVKGNLDIKIYNVLGQLLYQTNHQSENGTVSIQPDLSAGSYFITIQTEKLIEQQKIIKK